MAAGRVGGAGSVAAGGGGRRGSYDAILKEGEGGSAGIGASRTKVGSLGCGVEGRRVGRGEERGGGVQAGGQGLDKAQSERVRPSSRSSFHAKLAKVSQFEAPLHSFFFLSQPGRDQGTANFFEIPSLRSSNSSQPSTTRPKATPSQIHLPTSRPSVSLRTFEPEGEEELTQVLEKVSASNSGIILQRA